MKARSLELVDKSIAAMVAAIEVYNKPDFKYREEAFAVLAINAWELLLKAKWLKDHGNKMRSLYVTEKRIRPNGKPYKYPKVKMTGSGNPFTHSLDYVAKKLLEMKLLDNVVYRNITALCEIRDSAVHFYNNSNLFAVRLQEIGSASVRNYVRLAQDWFGASFSQYNFYLMPLAFIGTQGSTGTVMLNKEERNVVSYLDSLSFGDNPKSKYAVALNVELKFLRSKAQDALKVQISNDPAAVPVQLTEEHLKAKYPLTYATLNEECEQRYSDFKINQRYHKIRKPLKADTRYCHVRKLDPNNPKSLKQEWYSRAIFNVLDTYYTVVG